MKIVFVLPEMRGGGTERVVASLSSEFINRGYEVAIMLFAGDQVVYELNPKVEVVRVGAESKGNPLIRFKRLVNMRRFYKENEGCYIFAFSVMGTVFSVLSAFGIKHRLLVSERNDPTKMHHQGLRDWAYSKADCLVFQTEDMVKLFPKKIQSKGTVIPNPVSEDIPEPYVGVRDHRIVNVARLQPQKNHRLLMISFAMFLDMLEDSSEEYNTHQHANREVGNGNDTNDFTLHIYGEGSLKEELTELAEELEISDKVFLHGFTNNAREEIKNAGMFALSSDYEGISNSMIEALAMGIPTISTDCPVGGSRMYIEDGVSGLLTPVGDSKGLANAMYRVATELELANTLSTNAAKVREKYSLSKIADEFLIAAGLTRTV